MAEQIMSAVQSGSLMAFQLVFGTDVVMVVVTVALSVVAMDAWLDLNWEISMADWKQLVIELAFQTVLSLVLMI